MSGGFYHEGSRELQDRSTRAGWPTGSRSVKVRDAIDDDDRAFIESMDMLFLATADADGRPECSYKGGEPGFVRVLDERTIAFPGYDGNGMFMSFGNVLVNPEVGLLFISFERQTPAAAERDREHRPRRPAARTVAGGAARDPRPRARGVSQLPALHPQDAARRALPLRPRGGHEPPVPEWKTRDWARDVLPSSDQASRASVSAPSIARSRAGRRRRSRRRAAG